jgi:hypothetical protein
VILLTDGPPVVARCSCGKEPKARIFHVEGFNIRGAECPACGKAFLNSEDIIRFAEYKKSEGGVDVAKRVVC